MVNAEMQTLIDFVGK